MHDAALIMFCRRASSFSLLRENGAIVAFMSSNAGDLLYGYLRDAEEATKSILGHFSAGAENKSETRLCGREIQQRADYSFSVTVTYNTEKIKPAHYGRDQRLNQKCSE